jgi:hypothetical protein
MDNLIKMLGIAIQVSIRAVRVHLISSKKNERFVVVVVVVVVHVAQIKVVSTAASVDNSSFEIKALEAFESVCDRFGKTSLYSSVSNVIGCQISTQQRKQTQHLGSDKASHQGHCLDFYDPRRWLSGC